jgi:hypothetical protein
MSYMVLTSTAKHPMAIMRTRNRRENPYDQNDFVQPPESGRGERRRRRFLAMAVVVIFALIIAFRMRPAVARHAVTPGAEARAVVS